ncbi:MAG TPA: DNA translocase FtsK [Chloroflexi bacterium]|nr:DNA translocase FtsK [Chloroflexota bacterium]
MNKQLLELQADRIEAVLGLHNVDAQVIGGAVTPRWIRFQVLPAIGAKISKIKGLSEELAAALDVPDCRVSRRGAAVAVEVPRHDPRPVRLLPLYRQLTASSGDSIPPLTATLGLSEDGAPLLIRLPSPDVAHILAAGATGSGKTVLLQSIILSLAMSNSSKALSLVIIDPKRSALRLFDALPHLACPVIWDPEEVSKVFQRLMPLMERRGRDTRNPSPHFVLVIDELADLLMTSDPPVQRALTWLIQHGREAGIHVVAATQKPTATVLGTLIKANFPVRLVGRMSSANDARTAAGWSGTGAEHLMGRGDFIAIAEGRSTRFQAAHVSPAEIGQVIDKLRSDSTNLSWSPPATHHSSTPDAIDRVFQPMLEIC